MIKIFYWLKSFWKPEESEEKETSFAEMARAILLNEYYKSSEYKKRFRRLYDKIKDIDMDDNEVYEQLNKFKNDITEIKTDIKWIKFVIPILISIFGIITPLMISLQSAKFDAKVETINTKMEANQQEIFNEIKLLRNDFQHERELNKIEIEKEVLKHIRR